MIIKRSVALLFALFSCIYFFTTNNSNTEEVTEIQVAPSEVGNSRLLSKLACERQVLGAHGAENRSVLNIHEDLSTEATTQFSTEVEFRKKSSEDKPSIAHVEEVTEKETSLEVFKYEEKSENILSAHAMNIADNEHASEERSQSNKGCGFYASISGGKVYSDSSELFVSGIKAIGDRIINLIKEDHYINIIIKTVATKQFENIKQFNGKVDFQWLGSASLGYYAAENGRVDFEVMYSKVNIKDSNATPIFDKSAGIFTFLLNFYYNPRIQNTKFAPYAGLGIGPTVFRLKKVNEPNKDLMPLNVPWFAYQVKLGVDYSIIPEIKTFLGYRYFSIPIALADDIATHNIEVGLLFNF